MKNQRLKLDQLQVQSFITNLNSNKRQTIMGGIYLEETEDGPTETRCDTVYQYHCLPATHPWKCDNSEGGTNGSDPNGPPLS